ncbi:MAG: hypothetical protein ACRDFA_02495, partial [bacterium]
MPRLIMKTLPRAATVRMRKDAPTFKGAVHFELQVWDRGEVSTIWQGGRAPSTAAEWLKQATPDGRIIVPPPPIILDAAPVELPAASL